MEIMSLLINLPDEIKFPSIWPWTHISRLVSNGLPISTLGCRTLPERLFADRIVNEKRNLETEMKALIFASIIIALSAVASAEAKGCLKGAAVGGVAGHYSGHHGLLGAAAGCVIGRHEANKRDRLQKNQIDRPNRDLRNGEERL
jgi:hypothetical protein